MVPCILIFQNEGILKIGWIDHYFPLDEDML